MILLEPRKWLERPSGTCTTTANRLSWKHSPERYLGIRDPPSAAECIRDYGAMKVCLGNFDLAQDLKELFCRRDQLLTYILRAR
jgi:hypothetical protein